MSVFCKVSWKMKESRRFNTVPKDVNKCSLLFGHPEFFVDNRSEDVKGKEFQRRMRAVVIDGAHLVLQWYLYILFQKLFFRMLLICHILFH